MDLIHKFLNLVAPPFTFFSLCLFLPPYWAFKFLLSTLSCFFSENVAGNVVLITGASSGIGEVVNNAAISTSTLFEETPDITNLRPIMETNFWGSVYATYFTLPHLRNSKGKIVGMTSSADSRMPAPRRNVYSASKAAFVSMYETLRVEVGSEIGITIVTPGYIESELTKGKYLMADGKMDVDQDLRDVEVSAMPVGSVSGCADAARGDRYFTVPAWFRMTYIFKVLCPELVEWSFRFLHLTGSGT